MLCIAEHNAGGSRFLQQITRSVMPALSCTIVGGVGRVSANLEFAASSCSILELEFDMVFV